MYEQGVLLAVGWEGRQAGGHWAGNGYWLPGSQQPAYMNITLLTHTGMIVEYVRDLMPAGGFFFVSAEPTSAAVTETHVGDADVDDDIPPPTTTVAVFQLVNSHPERKAVTPAPCI